MKRIELENIISPHLKRCRSGDWEHAKRVAYWANILGEGRNDLHLLTIASLIHDIGWRDLIPNEKITFEKLKQFEEQANKNSKPYAKEILKELNLNEKEIEIILKLIESADRHESTNEIEAIIVDADTLSKLCIEHIQEKYSKSDWLNVYEKFKSLAYSRTKTKNALKLIPSLLEKLDKDIENST